MEHKLSLSTIAVDHQRHNDFWYRLRKNIILELKKSLVVFSQVYFVVRIILVTLNGALEFLFSFSVIKEIAAVALPPLIVYVVGQYLTVIPTFFVLILMFLPIRYTGGLLVVAVLYSFFDVLLV